MTTSQDADEKLVSAFGKVALIWGQLEFGVDFLVMLLHWRFGGSQTIERVAPWALSRNLDYIKRYFRKHRPGHPITADICQLIDDISDASVTRHDLLHGVIIDLPEGAGAATLIRLLRDSDGGLPHEKRFEITTTAVHRHAFVASILTKKLIDLAAGLSAAQFNQDKTDKPAGES